MEQQLLYKYGFLAKPNEINQNIKTESATCSKSSVAKIKAFDWNSNQKETNLLEDSDDEELLLALSALEEYPDEPNLKPSRKTVKRKANKAAPTLHTKRPKIGRYSYSTDAEGFVDVYIGSHCENIGRWNCMAGYGVYFGENHPLNVAKAATGRMTTNVGAIKAAIEAIETALRVGGIEKLCLHTDSEFLLNAATSWMFAWKRRGWRTQTGKVVQNRKELEKLDALLGNDSIDVKWHNAKGSNNAFKAMHEAKELARQGNEKYSILHPRKEMDNSFDEEDFDCCFY